MTGLKRNIFCPGCIEVWGETMIISDHAISRFRKRTGSKADDEGIKSKIETLFKKSVEVELEPSFKALALLNNRLKPARYYSFSQFIFVISEDVLVTIHFGEAKRWIKK